MTQSTEKNIKDLLRLAISEGIVVAADGVNISRLSKKRLSNLAELLDEIIIDEIIDDKQQGDRSSTPLLEAASEVVAEYDCLPSSVKFPKACGSLIAALNDLSLSVADRNEDEAVAAEIISTVITGGLPRPNTTPSDN